VHSKPHVLEATKLSSHELLKHELLKETLPSTTLEHKKSTARIPPLEAR